MLLPRREFLPQQRLRALGAALRRTRHEAREARRHQPVFTGGGCGERSSQAQGTPAAAGAIQREGSGHLPRMPR